MQNLFEQYIQGIAEKFSHQETSELGYRTEFETLVKGIFKSTGIKRIDHDPKAKQGNKPDFILYNHSIPILYIETKDIGVSLDKIEQSKQMSRYYGYTNLVLTDYTEFRFYRNGLRYENPIKIATYDFKNRIITPIPQNYQFIEKTLLDFPQSQKEPIKSGKHLAKIMGGKAQRIRDNVKTYLATESEKNKEILNVYGTIKILLVHDLKPESFADLYAQTLVYGLFVARFNDTTPESFTRREARDLVPASNPLLRHFFDHIVGPDFDKRLEYIVDELCEVFSHANVQELMKEYYKTDLRGEIHEGPDPVIHFYEDFLQEYDAKLRKKMGAFYTPLPVVKFIINSVEHILKKDFNLSNGLADSSKINDVHKVQILDPAVGTGTFLTEALKKIYTHFDNQKGRWHSYVHHDLLPRLYGFEIMMAPYTIAHLKMSMVLKDTGFKYYNNTRLRIYLTNSLEKPTSQEDMLAFDFAASVAEESKEAAVIKDQKPIMVVLGNPPYSGESSNKGEWILKLLEDYKKEPGGNIKLQEKNPKWINDDYVKFLRFGQYFIEKNRTGIVAFINAHGFLDNPTFRGMRWNLLKTYDKIYILNLHGNSKKKEIAPDGGKDENVFDIQQGVSINIFVKTNKKNPKDLATVFYQDLWGGRQKKYDYLAENNLNTVPFQEIQNKGPMYFMVPKDLRLEEKYNQGFAVNELFKISSVGVVTANDEILIATNKKELILKVQNHFKITPDEKFIQEISYRPFDYRFIYFDQKLIERSREKVMQHFIKGWNIGLNWIRPMSSQYSFSIFISKYITDQCSAGNKSAGAGISYLAPLYIYDNEGSRTSNFNLEISNKIEDKIGKMYPEKIFDYIYAILHSSNYRKKYKELLKINFPRIPYPKDKKTFNLLTLFGKKLRELHLLESLKIKSTRISYPIEGTDLVENIKYNKDKVFINKDQYFGKVPEIAWNIFIGGYQPAQKWLKDRKGSTLTNEDIEHYQKIIVALIETDKVMKKIDTIKIL